MRAERLAEIIGSDFYAGVPDSQLRALCDYLMNRYGIDPRHHVIAANEGGCAAMAAGYHLATGKVPVVYMQNSGEGNIINPAASLLSGDAYAIPVVFVIGWRGEPGVRDEPQHAFQGRVTLRLLEDMGIPYFVIGRDTPDGDARDAMGGFGAALAAGGSVAFVVRKGALEYDARVEYKNGYDMLREDVIRHIADAAGDDPIVSTTGKASRELFEIREQNGQGHQRDFLTVGSMGHCSSIALGIAAQKPNARVWCVDGDGAALMHMGAMAVIGACGPHNLIHVVINNEAHETVGGMPTVAARADFVQIARGCGYPYAASVASLEDLDLELEAACGRGGLALIEAKCRLGAREDLGRPTATPMENKEKFMEYVRSHFKDSSNVK